MVVPKNATNRKPHCACVEQSAGAPSLWPPAWPPPPPFLPGGPPSWGSGRAAVPRAVQVGTATRLPILEVASCGGLRSAGWAAPRMQTITSRHTRRPTAAPLMRQKLGQFTREGNALRFVESVPRLCSLFWLPKVGATQA